MDKRCGLLNRPTESRRDEARRMGESAVGPDDVIIWSLVGPDVQETNLIEIQVDLYFE